MNNASPVNHNWPISIHLSLPVRVGSVVGKQVESVKVDIVLKVPSLMTRVHTISLQASQRRDWTRSYYRVTQRKIAIIRPSKLRPMNFPSGSMVRSRSWSTYRQRSTLKSTKTNSTNPKKPECLQANRN